MKKNIFFTLIGICFVSCEDYTSYPVYQEEEDLDWLDRSPILGRWEHFSSIESGSLLDDATFSTLILEKDQEPKDLSGFYANLYISPDSLEIDTISNGTFSLNLVEDSLFMTTSGGRLFKHVFWFQGEDTLVIEFRGERYTVWDSYRRLD